MKSRMKWILLAFVVLCIAMFVVLKARFGSPSVAYSRLDNPAYAARYNEKAALAQQNKSSIRLIFLGDSIFGMYDSPKSFAGQDFSYQDVWQHYYGDRNALNLGFLGDTTSNVLGRIRNGEVDGLSPTLVAVLVGTNNLQRFHRFAFWSEESDVRGIEEVVKELHSHLPNAHILLVSVLPNGDDHSTWLRHVTARLRDRRIRQINIDLSSHFSHDTVPYLTYADLTSDFSRNGQVDSSLFGDGVHLTVRGQARLASALETQISQLLGDSPKQPIEVQSDSFINVK
jgi:lysophospholipase L1-like esterase